MKPLKNAITPDPWIRVNENAEALGWRRRELNYVLQGVNPMMKQEQTQKFKKLFEDQKAALLYSHKWVHEEFTLNVDEMSDEADLSSAELEQGMKMRLRSRETLFMKKIDEALDKIQAGNFGVCECCDQDIELLRLEVRPTANLCLSCKEEEEIREIKSADGRKSKSIGLKGNLRIA